MGTEARARLGLGALLLATLFAFGQLFAESSYSGPALLGCLVAAAIAVGGRRLGASTLVTILVSSIALIAYLGVIFQSPQTFYGLPTVDALKALGRTVGRATEASRIDYAPVPMRPGYIVMCVVGMWAITTLGEIATFRWKRPLVASFGPIALFSFLIVVGSGMGTELLVGVFLAALLTYWGLESSHRLRSWGRWVHAWADRAGFEEENDPVTGRVARRMGAAVVAAALAAPLVLPAIDESLLSWRSGQGAGGFGSGSGNVDLLVSVKPQLIEQADVELFRVRSEQPAYWRLASLVSFDGETWKPLSASEQPPTNAGQVEALYQPSGDVEAFDQSFVITELEGDRMPAAVQPLTVEMPEFEGRLEVDIRYDDETGELILPDGMAEGLSYEVSSVAADLSYKKLTNAEVGALGEAYTQLPLEVAPELRAIAERWTADAPTPFQKLVAIQDHLRDFEYSLDVEPSASDNYLLQFLTETQEGYCQQLATAFAALARSLGYPARVSVGFLPGLTSIDSPNDYVVRGVDAHAWPEVYFFDRGWVAFEPTPRSDSTVVPPRYTIESSTPGGPGGIDGFVAGIGGGVPDAGGLAPPQNCAADAPGGAANALCRPNTAAAGEARRSRIAGRGGGTAGRDRGIADEWKGAFGRLASATGIALLVFLIVVPVAKELRIRRRYAGSRDPVTTAIAAFRQFEADAADLAAPRARAETASSYSRRLAAARRVPRGPAARLAEVYEAAEYSPSGVTANQAREAAGLARELRGRLWARATWLERAARLFSAKGLVPPRPRGVRARLRLATGSFKTP